MFNYTGRGYPDISMLAAPYHYHYSYHGNKGSAKGKGKSSGSNEHDNGQELAASSSVAAFGAVVALLNQQRIGQQLAPLGTYSNRYDDR